jgi:hypothetical protein
MAPSLKLLPACLQDTERFCRATLCDRGVAEFVNGRFVCWGGDISFPDAHRLSSR